MLLSTDRKILELLNENPNGCSFKQACDLSGLQAGDVTKSLQYLTTRELVMDRPVDGLRIFFITKTGEHEIIKTDKPKEQDKQIPAEPAVFQCQYCKKEYSEKGWLERHEEKCKAKPKTLESTFARKAAKVPRSFGTCVKAEGLDINELGVFLSSCKQLGLKCEIESFSATIKISGGKID